jgi:capsule polysaccharide export protein KpsE/RkpR
MEINFNSFELIKTALRWKFHLLAVLLISALASIFFSSPLFIKPQFKSVAVIYPSNLVSYSDESATEQLLQWCFSEGIVDSVCQKHNLGQHYGIDRESPIFKTLLSLAYKDHVSISKTPYQSVQVQVMDENPQLACDIVNSILKYLNKTIREAHFKQDSDVVATYNKLIDLKKAEIDSTEKSLAELRQKYGLTNYDGQTEEVTKGFLGTAKGQVNKNEVLELKRNLEDKGGLLLNNSLRLKKLYSELSKIMDLKATAERGFYRDYNYTNMVTRPTVADKKCYPVRSVIVLTSVAASFFLALIILIFIEIRKSKPLAAN